MLDLDSPFHTPAQFQQRLTRFIDQWGKRYPSIRGSLPEYQWRYYHQYLNYPVQLRRMRYTTNWIERFNKEVRKTTQHVNSFPNPDAALNMIFMVTKQMEEKTYRIPSLQTRNGEDLIWTPSDTELLTLREKTELGEKYALSFVPFMKIHSIYSRHFNNLRL